MIPLNSCLTRRLIAFLVDVALAGLLFLLLARAWPALGEAGGGAGGSPAPTQLLLTYGLRVLPELVWRRSPGKFALRLDTFGPRWAPPVRHAWLLLPLPLAVVAPDVDWYALIVVALGAGTLLARDHRSPADRITRTTVVTCASPADACQVTTAPA